MFIDLTNQKFGRLTALERVEKRNGKYFWKCVCNCGKYTKVTTSDLRSGHTKSCGCYHTEVIRSAKSHGVSKTRIYKIYKGIKQRCNNSVNPNFIHYGGKGIKMCDEWLDNPESFYIWAISNGYKPGLTIDRIDGSKDYSPENCRWATRLEQSNNLKSNLVLKYNGQVNTLAEWSRILNIKYTTLQQRLYRGWTVNDALTTPVGGK